MGTNYFVCFIFSQLEFTPEQIEGEAHLSLVLRGLGTIYREETAAPTLISSICVDV